MGEHNSDAVSRTDLESSPGAESLTGPELWRCRRLGPISGRYEGEMTTPYSGRYLLDLRVDIDPRHANSPVMERVSGDLYQIFHFRWFRRTFHWRIYRESWIVQVPTFAWDRCRVEIAGEVHFWKGGHARTDVRIVIPWETFTISGPAEVAFTEQRRTAQFSCVKKSTAFREVTLEVDVCNSVNTAPIVPTYDTHAHPNRPPSLSQRTLTIEGAYEEAGIALTINPVRTLVDDSAADFTRWSPDELHDAMEQHFSRYSGAWPKWHLWCLLAGTFDSPSVGGIMFDAASAYGGAGVPPERQGCAVFRNHSWFNDLAPNPPATDDEAAAMRKYLYTYVHEIGHAFNFLHSWDKGRPDALSWMNYDWRYDNRNGADTFWGNFACRFDDEELMHLRHGDRTAVIMGGDPWASGGHLESPPDAMVDMLGETPIELLVRSKSYFHFMEPVNIELRVKNTSGMSLEVDTRLHPEFGGITVYIRRPDGRILKYAPILCKLAPSELKTLKREDAEVRGEDRHSENVFLQYGSYGHYFDEPGVYLVRAAYQGSGDVMVLSNVHRVRIGRPFSRDEEQVAQDFFSYEAGMALYLNGSSATFLTKGMDVLEAMADRFRENPVGAHLSLALAAHRARPFFRIDEGGRMLKVRDTDPEQALDLTARTLSQQATDETTLTNLTYHQCRRSRADLLTAVGNKAEAKKELKTLVDYLKRRGVNKPVLDEIDAYAKSL
jgi:hypothetical protein